MYFTQNVIAILVVGVLLLVITQVFGGISENFNCTTDINDTKGQTACTTTKNNVWLYLQIASYGVIIVGIVAMFTPLGGRMG